MTILEKIKFEEDWLSEVNLTKENIKIAFAGIRATALESQPCEDCVNREDAINVAIDAVDEWDGGCNTSRATMISNAIKDLPSVKPQPQKGKWNVFDAGRDYTTYSCSECGRLVTVYYDFGKPKDIKKEFPFCNCGADMRGEKNDG